MKKVFVKTLDNIDDKILDSIKEKFGKRQGYRISDDRLSKHGNGDFREYFLFACDSENIGYDFTFIWISNNIWQYRYENIYCKQKAHWIDPLLLLNNLLNS